MLEVKFNHADRSWDRYRTFYNDVGCFTHFETGELMVRSAPEPHQRRRYDEYNIQLVTTTEKECPPLYLRPESTEPLTKAWLTQGGQQMLAIDYEQKIAVRIKESWGKSPALMFLPSHVEHARALWTGAKRKPVVLEDFEVSMPDRTIKADLSQKLDDVQAAICAIYRIQESEARYWSSEPQQALIGWRDMSVEQIVADITGHPKMGKQMMHNIFHKGFTYPRSVSKVDYLYVK